MVNKKIKLTELLEKYPKLKVLGEDSTLHNIGGDLVSISNQGAIKRIKKANVTQCLKNGKRWVRLEVLDYELIDKGMSDSEVLI